MRNLLSGIPGYFRGDVQCSDSYANILMHARMTRLPLSPHADQTSAAVSATLRYRTYTQTQSGGANHR